MIIPEFPQTTKNTDHAKKSKVDTAAEIAATIRAQQEEAGFVDIDNWFDAGYTEG